jgi:two-component system sensor histidine kinase KdpD
MRELRDTILNPAGLALGTSGPRGYGFALFAIALTTAAIGAVNQFVDLGHVGAIYLVPVLVAAMRWGLGPALLASGASTLASAFFFYPPIYSFQMQKWEQVVDLSLFTIVALVISHLVVRIKSHAEKAERATNEARVRAETEHLREALIGSVSHELRTPLASILGAATVLSGAPAVQAEPRLAALAHVARDEAERLNNDIQNLLDASRISSEGLRPRLEWAEPADIVNAAIDRHRTRLADHAIEVELPAELPLAYVDPVLVRQALWQIIDNAAKYSSSGAPIRIVGRRDNGDVAISVSDRGAGLSFAEQARLGERFFRGRRTAATTTGSGLGVWIAKAFLHANGGSLEVESMGEGHGTVVTIRLAAPPRGADELSRSELSNE